MPCATRSDTLRRTALPTEVKANIYSFCDRSTLAVLARLSSEREVVTPLLYENVEIRSLDGLKSLFFLKNGPTTARLSATRPALCSIRTLTLDILVNVRIVNGETVFGHKQRRHPRFRPLEEVTDRFGDVVGYDDSGLKRLVPHHLLRAARVLGRSTVLALPQLVLKMDYMQTLGLFELLCVQLFPHLNPRVFVNADPTTVVRPSNVAPKYPKLWKQGISMFETSFFAKWTDLEQVIELGETALTMCCNRGRDRPLFSYWSPSMDKEKKKPRPIEFVFNIASRDVGYTAFIRLANASDNHLECFLDLNGATTEHVDARALRVKLRVRAADVKAAKADVRRLEDSLKRVVEVVVG